jgi:hypothetical protein
MVKPLPPYWDRTVSGHNSTRFLFASDHGPNSMHTAVLKAEHETLHFQINETKLDFKNIIVVFSSLLLSGSSSISWHNGPLLHTITLVDISSTL